jgi:erythromycin esterase-like protein
MMRISLFDDKTNRRIELNKILTQSSSELNQIPDLDPLVDAIGDAKFVLLGEASHGTHEYYTWRAHISKRLIEEKGFSFIAVEGDWPDCYRINRYIKGYPASGNSAFEVLHAFNRWPTWMWANWEMVALTDWLRNYNQQHEGDKIGFYGLDVYSLWESLEALITYLDKKDPGTWFTALKVRQCFDPYSDDEGRAYARASVVVPDLCEDEVVKLLMEIRENMSRYNTDPEAVMSTEQNAYVLLNAERYYRAMVRPGSLSWNIRDHHMSDTLDRLMQYHGPEAKAIVWEHNTHIGDARATDMIDEGLVNVGQLVRENHALEGVYIVGFGSYQGSVVAGRQWGDVMRSMQVPQAMSDSWEHILHQLDARDRIVFMRSEMQNLLGNKSLDHRAIGVVYHPQYEKPGNYVPSKIPLRYDAFIFIDTTTALHPLHIKTTADQIPETFPFGV